MPSNVKDFELYEHNVVLSKKCGGKVPTYLKPIGHSKEQKQSSSKMKDYIETRYSTIETSSKRNATCINKPLRTLTKFYTTKLNPSLIKAKVLNKALTLKTIQKRGSITESVSPVKSHHTLQKKL
jgi:hypothetical protein